MTMHISHFIKSFIKDVDTSLKCNIVNFEIPKGFMHNGID